MHPKRGELFNRFFPAHVESVDCTHLPELRWADNKRMASFSKHTVDPHQALSQTAR